MSSNQWNPAGPNPVRKQSLLFRLLATLLLTALIAGQMTGIARAEDTITGVELTTPATTIYVGEDAIALTLWATVSGSSTKKDVTSSATWTSSNSAISVSGGVVTATSSASSVVITGKYSGYTATVTMKSLYKYSSVEIRKSGADAGTKLSAQLGDTLLLDAYGVGTSAADSQYVTDDATWTSSNTDVATVDGGDVTLVASGTTTIKIGYLGRTDSIALTVASPYSGLTLSETGPVERYVDDEDLQLGVTAALKTGGTEDVTDAATWTSSSESVATVDEDGLVSFVGVGTATVQAAYRGVSQTVTVVVRTPYEALRTTPDKTLKLSLQDSASEVTAYVLKDASSQEDVTTAATWTSSDLVVATVDSVNGKTYITPKSAGTTTVKASYKGLTRSIAVTVYPTVTSMTLAVDSIDTYREETGNLPTVTGEALSGDSVDISDGVVWSSDDEDIVTVEDGKWTAIDTGTATLTATLPNSRDENGVPFAAELTVNVNKKVHLMMLDADSVSIIAGQEVAYPTVHVVYENGDEEDVRDKVEWKSSSANVFVKDATHTWKGFAAAKATMTGTYLNETIKVQAVVEDEYVVYVIDPKSIDLTIKKSKTIKVTGKTKTGKKVSLGSRIEWSSSDESILSVNGASVKSLAEGSGKLTATFQGKELSVPFAVSAKLTKLSASDSSISLASGNSETVKISAIYENGKTVDATANAEWKATSSRVATVSGGVIKAVGKGSTTIKATYGGKTVTIRVKVTS